VRIQPLVLRIVSMTGRSSMVAKMLIAWKPPVANDSSWPKPASRHLGEWERDFDRIVGNVYGAIVRTLNEPKLFEPSLVCVYVGVVARGGLGERIDAAGPDPVRRLLAVRGRTGNEWWTHHA
jgi:hypothetical protein